MSVVDRSRGFRVRVMKVRNLRPPRGSKVTFPEVGALLVFGVCIDRFSVSVPVSDWSIKQVSVSSDIVFRPGISLFLPLFPYDSNPTRTSSPTPVFGPIPPSSSSSNSPLHPDLLVKDLRVGNDSLIKHRKQYFTWTF